MGLAGGCHDQLAVFHSPGCHQPVGHFFDLCISTPEDYHLQAVVMVDMHVQGGDNQLMVVMLQLVQGFVKLPLVVVVNQAQ